MLPLSSQMLKQTNKHHQTNKQNQEKEEGTNYLSFSETGIEKPSVLFGLLGQFYARRLVPSSVVGL